MFFFNDTATTEIYTLSLHDALPISFSSTNSFLSVEEVIAEPHRILYKKNLAFFRETVIKYLKKVGLESGEEFLKKKMKELRSEEHTSELQSRQYLVCRLLLEKKL